jgi:O-antigen/teichoic acid export membrane protein
MQVPLLQKYDAHGGTYLLAVVSGGAQFVLAIGTQTLIAMRYERYAWRCTGVAAGITLFVALADRGRHRADGIMAGYAAGMIVAAVVAVITAGRMRKNLSAPA